MSSRAWRARCSAVYSKPVPMSAWGSSAGGRTRMGSPSSFAPAAPHRGEGLAARGVVHDRGQPAVGVVGRDAHAPLGDPPEVVDRPVERIDEPADARSALGGGALLGHQRVARAGGEDRPGDQLLGRAVGVADQVGAAGLGREPRGGLAGPAQQQLARGARRGEGQREQLLAHVRCPTTAGSTIAGSSRWGKWPASGTPRSSPGGKDAHQPGRAGAAGSAGRACRSHTRVGWGSSGASGRASRAIPLAAQSAIAPQVGGEEAARRPRRAGPRPRGRPRAASGWAMALR